MTEVDRWIVVYPEYPQIYDKSSKRYRGLSSLGPEIAVWTSQITSKQSEILAPLGALGQELV